MTGHAIKHVLLISVDGMHAIDLRNYVATHPDSTLSGLSRHGITYTNNSTSSPSDSFPGLASLITGGSPVTTGLWYDDTYNRVLSPPAETDGLGNPGGSCPGKIGTNVAWDEAVDIDLTRLDAGGGLNQKVPRAQPQQRVSDLDAARVPSSQHDFRSGQSSGRPDSVGGQTSVL